MDVSIIIPVYNTERFLRECLDSVINQKTKYKFEIIVINDGSVDSSLKILKEYKDKIIIIDKNHTGPGDSRNIAIKKSQGKFLMFVDSDDYVSSDFIEIMMSELLNHKADIVICDFFRVIDDHKTLVPKGKHKVYTHGNYAEVLRMEFHSCNKIIKKDLLERNLYPTGMLFEDVVTISKCIIDAEKIVKIDKGLYYYRKNLNSITNVLEKSNYDSLKAINMIEQKFLDNNYKDEIEYLYVNNILVDLIIKVIKRNTSNCINEVKELKEKVQKKYPKWYLNKYLKKEKNSKKMYLFFLRFDFYYIIKLVFRNR